MESPSLAKTRSSCSARDAMARRLAAIAGVIGDWARSSGYRTARGGSGAGGGAGGGAGSAAGASSTAIAAAST
jgi:hypothetical protein